MTNQTVKLLSALSRLPRPTITLAKTCEHVLAGGRKP